MNKFNDIEMANENLNNIDYESLFAKQAESFGFQVKKHNDAVFAYFYNKEGKMQIASTFVNPVTATKFNYKKAVEDLEKTVERNKEHTENKEYKSQSDNFNRNRNI